MLTIGIVGLGVVGGTLRYGFNRLGHKVLVHDTKLKTKIDELLPADLIFVCVPTPMNDDKSCDINVVDSVVRHLADLRYSGLVVIKSTVPPGTTDWLCRKNNCWVRLAFCPEFLREKSTYSDFVDNHDVCIIGAVGDIDFDLVKRAHGYYPKQFVRLLPIEAELTKYFSNTFNALRIIFANQFYEVCRALDVDYQAVKDAIAKRSSIGPYYLDCAEHFRGFGGACLPKDTAAMAHFVEEKGINAPVFDWILKQNAKL